MLQRLRHSFAAKLLAAGLILAIAVVGGVSSYLLVSRDRQTRAGALSNSDNRAVVMRQVLDRFTGVQSASAAIGLADQPALVMALSRSDPAAALRTLFSAIPSVDLSGEALVVADARGSLVYRRVAADLGPATPISALPPAALQLGSLVAARDPATSPPCDLALPSGVRTRGVCGIELIAGGQPSYDVAVPVMSGGRVIGVVAYLAPLAAQLQRFRTLFEFPTAFIAASQPDREVRLVGDRDQPGTSAEPIRRGVGSGQDQIHATYLAPGPSGGVEEVAGSFVALPGLDHREVVGYMGVEAPLSIFVGDTRTDELTLVAMTLLVLLITAIAVALFVSRFVRRPVGILAGGVHRIAGGDYSTPIVLDSGDELGRLAADVNRMRDSISAYLGEIRRGRERLDSAVARMSSVSRTLTLTTAGVGALETEVVRTARAIVGDRCSALLAKRSDQGQLVAETADPPAEPSVLTGRLAEDLLAGRVHRRAPDSGGGSSLAVPMHYQDRVIGALVVEAPPGAPGPGSDDEAVLSVLANNTAVAIENSRLFEQERETVRRLRELDSMKNDFLATVQHELRTPLTAILGLADLMEMCWETWADEPKLEAVRDIQVAARNLHDMVETIINFAMLEDESMRLDLVPVSVRPAVEAARGAIASRLRGGLPLPVEVEGAADAAVLADPIRFEEVMRALLDNAIKFSPQGGAVRVLIHGEGRRVRIDVVDEGIGIAASEHGRIFDRFYQVDSTATRRSGGTGMGLALVKRLVEAHGATVTVSSRLGRGSRFRLLWPAASTEQPH